MNKSKYFFFAFLGLILSSVLYSQPLSNPQKDIVYEIKSEEGNNGIAITYNAEKELYYAAFGGNSDYPLEVFTAGGKNVYSKAIGFDARGLAYDAKKNCLIGNSYDDGGFYKIQLNDAGLPSGQIENTLKGKYQPDEQSGGSFNTKKKVVYYRKGISIYTYKISSGALQGQFDLSGISEREVENCVDYIVLYTGKKGYEFIIVNYLSPKIYYFDSKGKYVTNTQLPYSDYMHDFFNLSYSNDRLWIYSKDNRRWTAYKIF